MAGSKSESQASDPRPKWAVLHLWQIQSVRDLLGGLGIIGLIVVAHVARIVTVPLLLAVLFAYLLEPVVHAVTKAGRISRRATVSALLVLLALGLALPVFVGGGFAVVQGARLSGEVASRAGSVIASVNDRENPELLRRVGDGAWRSIRDFLVEVRLEAERLEQRVTDAMESPEAALDAEAGDDTGEDAAGDTEFDEPLTSLLGIDSRDVARALDSILEGVRANARLLGEQALTTGAGAVNVAIATAGSVGRLLFGAFLTAFFFYFVSSGFGGVTSFARGLLPTRNRERAEEIVGKMDHAISGFIRGRLTIAFFLAIFYTVGFALIGVPAPLIMGPCIAFLAIFPYATLLGIPVVVLFLWLEPHSGMRDSLWWVLLAPVAIYQIGQILDDYVLTPAIQGDATGLDTPTILFASIAGAAMLGFLGMLVAIPVAACLKILVVEVFWPRFNAWVEGRESDFLPIEED